VAADPYRWQRSLGVLDGDGIPVHEFFQNAARMGPATARHVANAILREDSRGARFAKEHRDSTRRIDAAVAVVMALHRAELVGADQLSIYI
jgi:phage terminase large subunit-like protein